jgi:hypothetical protein
MAAPTGLSHTRFASGTDDIPSEVAKTGTVNAFVILGNHYGISDLGTPPADVGQWGETRSPPTAWPASTRP